ncbi:MAG: hypothetical protein ACI4T9_05770 [Prevotella sp.]|jgi:vancomycin permeability regulator SanA
MTKKQRRRLISAVVIVAILLLPVVICNAVVDYTTSDDTFDDAASVPRCEYAMLLGTGPTRRFGKGPNRFYVNRIIFAEKVVLPVFGLIRSPEGAN